MSDDQSKRRGAAGSSYAIGYGKPPCATRFKPGQSGNPRGRPRERKNLATEVREALTAPVTVTLDGKKTVMTRRRAMLEKMMAKALSGDVKATLALLQLGDRHLTEEAAPQATALEADDLAVIQAFADALRAGKGGGDDKS